MPTSEHEPEQATLLAPVGDGQPQSPETAQTGDKGKRGTRKRAGGEKPATASKRKGVSRENGTVSGNNDGERISLETLKSLVRETIETFQPSEPRTPLIFSTMRKIMGDIIPLAKTHHNEDAGFWFRAIDEVCAHIQPLLVEHGLLAVPEVLEKTEVERVVKLDSGHSWVNIFSTVRTRWHLRSAIDGSEWPDPCITMGEGMSEQQHSTAAAQTMAYKQMLWQVFCIPVFGVQDPEATIGERSLPSTSHYVTPEAKSVAPDGPTTPGLFDDEIPDAEPVTTEPTTKKRRRGREPEMVSVGGAALPPTNGNGDETHDSPLPAVSEEPLGPGFVNILKTNLGAKKVSEQELFAHFKVEGFDGLKKHQMDEAMAFIQKGPQS